MELWTDYEGTVIDSVYPLKKLLLPEGRSAFFSTSNGKGGSTVIRLVACHFDEDEILARWQGVQALNHPNLLKLDHQGKVMLDDATVVYAVIEPVDANLAEIVTAGCLSAEETRQLGASAASALEVLHTNGFVHEHVEPANVFAVGEMVKLRSDCIRETPEGEAGREIKQRDVHNLGIVMLQALTQQTTLAEATRRRPLPAPFDKVIPKALSGEWGLVEIAAALKSAERPSVSATKPAPVRPEPPKATAPAPKPATERPVSTAQAAQPVSPAVSARPEPKQAELFPPSGNRSLPSGEPIPHTSEWIKLAVAGVAVVLLLWLGWHFIHSQPADHGKVQSTPPSGAVSQNAAPQPGAGKPAHAAPQAAASSGSGDWRVIAYTYNRRDQAQKKASTVAHQHPDLHPEVFSPTGRAPFLVAIGGKMSRDGAYALAHRARSLGLPRDTYAQNYTGRR